MIKREEIASPESCLNRSADDEPLFVLGARDRHAPTLVWLWAALREIDQENPAIVQDAQKCCVDMMAWAKEHGRQSCGLGQSALVAVMELIRMANSAVDRLMEAEGTHNQATPVEFIRAILAKTTFEKQDPAQGVGACDEGTTTQGEKTDE